MSSIATSDVTTDVTAPLPASTSRSAGLLYLVMAAGTAFGMGYAEPKLRVAGDAAETFRRMMSSETLFRLGFLSNVVALVAFLFLADALYHLFEGVDRRQARLLLVFVAAGTSIHLLSMAHPVVAMALAKHPYPGLDASQAQALALALLDAHWYGRAIAAIFWGLWLLPLGLLGWKSGWMPKPIAVLLAVGCFAYLADSAATLLFPAYSALTGVSLVVPTAGEIGCIIWLLSGGVRLRARRGLL